jgi:hypothetical protein
LYLKVDARERRKASKELGDFIYFEDAFHFR